MDSSEKTHTKELPDWEPDDAVLECITCLAKFSFARRRHHCRRCGHVICGTCSHGRLPLPELGYFTDVRICVYCHTIIMAKRRRLDINAVIKFISIYSASSRKYAKETAKLEEQLTQIFEQINIQRQIISDSIAKEEDHKVQEEKLIDLFQNDSMLRTDVMKLRISQGLKIKVALLPKGLAADKDKFKKKNVATEKENEAFDLKMQSLPQRYLIITNGPHMRLALSEVINRSDENQPRASKSSLRTLKATAFKDAGGVESFRKRIQHLKNSASASGENFRQSKKEKMKKEKINVLNFHWVRTINQLRRVGSWTAKSVSGTDFFGINLEWDGPSCWIEERDKDFNKKSGNENQSTVTTVPRTACLQIIEPSIDQRDHTDFSITQIKVKELLKAHKEKYIRRIKRQKPIIDALFAMKKITVDWNIPDHHEMLKQMWQGFHYPEELNQLAEDGVSMAFPGTKHNLWKTIGFQGADPTTDFRGMGLLSVKVLIYLGEHYPGLAQRLAKAGQKRTYPLCASAINICHLVGDFLTITKYNGPTRPFSDIPLFNIFCLAETIDYYQPQLHSYLAKQKEEEKDSQYSNKGRDIQDHYFEELVIAVLVLLDTQFVKLNAGYLDFPKILADIKQKVVDAIESEPVHFDAFVKMVLAEDEQPSNLIDSPKSIGLSSSSSFGTLPKGQSRLGKVLHTCRSAPDLQASLESKTEPDFQKLPTTSYHVVFSDDDDDEMMIYEPDKEDKGLGLGLEEDEFLFKTRKRSSWKDHEDEEEAKKKYQEGKKKDQQVMDDGKDKNQQTLEGRKCQDQLEEDVQNQGQRTSFDKAELQEQKKDERKEHRESVEKGSEKNKETNLEGTKVNFEEITDPKKGTKYEKMWM